MPTSIIRLGKLLIYSLVFYLVAMALVVAHALTSSYTSAEYAVVLGNEVNPSGEPSDRLAARLDKALELFEEGVVASILVSGGIGIEGHDEAQVMARYLIDQGVPPKRIVVDSDGYTTYRTAENAMRILGPDTTVIVVTQHYHVPRTRLAFTKIGFTNVDAAYPSYIEPRDVYSLAREVPAMIVYMLR